MTPLMMRGELEPDLRLLVRREHRDDARDGLGGVDRVQGRHDQVAGLGRRERGLDGLEVAHFADQDDVRVLAQRGAQRGREAVGVDADLALVHDRALVADQELDRVLDRDDVAGAVGVDVVDHRGERGRLARAGGAGDEDQAARFHGDALDDLGQHELLDRLHAERDHAEDDADRAALHEGVHAEAAEAGDRVGEVDLVELVEVRLLTRRHDRRRDRRAAAPGSAARRSSAARARRPRGRAAAGPPSDGCPRRCP